MLDERSIHGSVTHWSCPSTCEGKCFTHSLSHSHTLNINVTFLVRTAHLIFLT